MYIVEIYEHTKHPVFRLFYFKKQDKIERREDIYKGDLIAKQYSKRDLHRSSRLETVSTEVPALKRLVA